MGVASSSGATPLKRAGFDLIDESFKDADCYCAWQFVYYPKRFSRSMAPHLSTPPKDTGTAPTQ
jgi:hypothetical protein